MKTRFFMTLLMLAIVVAAIGKKKDVKKELWPDGTEISAWFKDTVRVDLSGLKHYDVTAYGVDRYADGVQTQQIQAVIDRCAQEGGGVIVIPRGTFLSGSLFFKPGTHLQIEEGGEVEVKADGKDVTDEVTETPEEDKTEEQPEETTAVTTKTSAPEETVTEAETTDAPVTEEVSDISTTNDTTQPPEETSEDETGAPA